MDNQSIQHTRWNCTYHIVFIPKYRRKIMYGELKRDLVEILKKLCEMKQVQIIEVKVCKDHIHMIRVSKGTPIRTLKISYKTTNLCQEMV